MDRRSERESLLPYRVGRADEAARSTLANPVPSSTDHVELHTDHSAIIRDIIIGFADGLTVPFALTAGLSS